MKYFISVLLLSFFATLSKAQVKNISELQGNYTAGRNSFMMQIDDKNNATFTRNQFNEVDALKDSKIIKGKASFKKSVLCIAQGKTPLKMAVKKTNNIIYIAYLRAAADTVWLRKTN